MPSFGSAKYTRIRNVQRVRRVLCDGRINYHHYHRPTRTKLPGDPGSPEFMAVYLQCEQRLKAGSFKAEEPHPEILDQSSSPLADIHCNDPTAHRAIYESDFWSRG